MSEQLVMVGRVLKLFGVAGEVVVLPTGDVYISCLLVVLIIMMETGIVINTNGFSIYLK